MHSKLGRRISAPYVLQQGDQMKNTLGAICLIAITGLAFLTAHGATLAEIKARGYMVVATEDDYKPFEFVADGKPTGFNNEMLAELRKVVPFEIRQEIIPWTGILAGVTTGKYDVAMTAATVTNERMQSLDFVAPIAETTNYYAKRKADDSIKDVGDLNGKSCGVQTGSAQLQMLPQLDALLAKSGGKIGTVRQSTSYSEAYQDLALGRTDCVINTIINLRSLANDKPNVFEVGKAVADQTVSAWAVSKGNTEVLTLLNDFIGKERQNGNFYKLQEKWFGQSFPNLPDKTSP